MIIFALSLYLRQRKGFLAFASKLKPFQWLQTFWQWLTRGSKNLKNLAEKAWQSSVATLQKLVKATRGKLPNLEDLLKKLPPRQKTIMAYLAWVKWNGEQGLAKQRAETAWEYANKACEAMPDKKAQIKACTHAFVEARYTTHPINAAQADETLTLIAQLKSELRNQQNTQSL